MYEVLYGVKPDVLHLRAFGAKRTIVEAREQLRKLNNRTAMCEGGGYRVWVPKRQVVISFSSSSRTACRASESGVRGPRRASRNPVIATPTDSLGPTYRGGLTQLLLTLVATLLPNCATLPS